MIFKVHTESNTRYRTWPLIDNISLVCINDADVVGNEHIQIVDEIAQDSADEDYGADFRFFSGNWIGLWDGYITENIQQLDKFHAPAWFRCISRCAHDICYV